MHSWGSKEAENAAEGIGRTDGIKSVEGIRGTDEIKSTDGSRRKCKEHDLILNLLHTGST